MTSPHGCSPLAWVSNSILHPLKNTWLRCSCLFGWNSDKPFVHEGSAGTRFEVFFKVEGSIFILESTVENQLNRRSVLSCRNITIYMSLKSFSKIFRKTSIRWIVAAYQNINVIHLAKPGHVGLIRKRKKAFMKQNFRKKRTASAEGRRVF
jgi:hypothetical protein